MNKNPRLMYRIEHKFDGQGPFTSLLPNGNRRGDEILAPLYGNRDYDFMVNRHCDDFANVYEEGFNIAQDGYTWVCAYKSLEDLLEFIHKEALDFLLETGFNVYAYEASMYQEGKQQYVFVKEFATKKLIEL